MKTSPALWVAIFEELFSDKKPLHEMLHCFINLAIFEAIQINLGG